MHAFAGLVSNLVDKSNPNLAPLNAQEHPPYGRGIPNWPRIINCPPQHKGEKKKRKSNGS